MAPFGKDPDNPHERQRPIPGNGDHVEEDSGEHETPHQRREFRRNSDVRAYSQADGAKVIVISPKMLVVAWGIVAAVVPAGVAVVFWLGGQVLSPGQAIESVRKEANITRDSLTALAARNFNANREAISNLGTRMDAAEQVARDQNQRIDLNTYLNCVTVRYIDGRLEPPECRAGDVRQFKPK
jgi:hypothetical protein